MDTEWMSEEEAYAQWWQTTGTNDKSTCPCGLPADYFGTCLAHTDMDRDWLASGIRDGWVMVPMTGPWDRLRNGLQVVS